MTIASSATRTQGSPGYYTHVLGGCTRGATRKETYHSLPKYKELLYSILMYKRSLHRMRLVPYSTQGNTPTRSVYFFFSYLLDHGEGTTFERCVHGNISTIFLQSHDSRCVRPPMSKIVGSDNNRRGCYIARTVLYVHRMSIYM